MRAVLLIPADGDPHGLLAPGKCGVVPPTAWLHPAVTNRPRGYGREPRQDVPERWLLSQTTSLAGVFRRDTTSNRGALVLVWEGSVCPEGCDRLLRLCGYQNDVTYDIDAAQHYALLGADRLGGEVVVLEDNPSPGFVPAVGTIGNILRRAADEIEQQMDRPPGERTGRKA